MSQKWYAEQYGSLLRFFDQSEEVIEHRPLDDLRVRLSYEVHAFRGDASHSGDWRSHKVFASEVWSAFRSPVIDMRDGSEQLSYTWALHYPDLAWVPPAGSGESTKTMWESRLEQLGVATWFSRAAAASKSMQGGTSSSEDALCLSFVPPPLSPTALPPLPAFLVPCQLRAPPAPWPQCPPRSPSTSASPSLLAARTASRR
eukprot:9467491-Pyramimonas_sp.AAC.1